MRKLGTASLAFIAATLGIPDSQLRALLAQEDPTTTPASQGAADAAQVLGLARGVVTGRLLDLDATTPWGGRAVRVVDRATGKVVAAVETAADGTFALPELHDGAYSVEVGELRVDAKVSAQGEISKLVIVGPREVVDGAGVGGGPGVAPQAGGAAGEGAADAGPSKCTVLLIGGGILVVLTGTGLGIGLALGGSRHRAFTIPFIIPGTVSPPAP